MTQSDNFTTIIRRGDISEWLQEDPILLNRELVGVYGVTGDEVWFKIGDGKSKFSELNYIIKISELLPYFDTYVRFRNNPVNYSRVILDRGIDEKE